MAVDVPGVLSVLESARLAKLKNLVILAGFCWRYDTANEEAHRKLSSGELGRVLSFDGLYYTCLLYTSMQGIRFQPFGQGAHSHQALIPVAGQITPQPGQKGNPSV